MCLSTAGLNHKLVFGGSRITLVRLDVPILHNLPAPPGEWGIIFPSAIGQVKIKNGDL
jgi:hypothetical protein